jgi:hypothetical protein
MGLKRGGFGCFAVSHGMRGLLMPCLRELSLVCDGIPVSAAG